MPIIDQPWPPEYESVAITGHRVYPDRGALYRGLDRINARRYYFGGAQGIDSDALEYVGLTRPRSQRIVVVPNRLIDQPRFAQMKTRQYATEVIELRNTGTNRYFIRNRYLVDNTNKTVAFYDFRGRGGTLQTMNYASSQRKLLTTNTLTEFDKNKILNVNKSQARAWINDMRLKRVNLSSIKMLIIQLILQVLDTTVRLFIHSLGYVGVKTLEALWSL